MRRLFFGGVHPQDKKDLSLNELSLNSVTAEKVIIPLKQHIGVECNSIVKEGDYVLCGQKIGEGKGLCVPVHSSVSGYVEKIDESNKTIVIVNDSLDKKIDFNPYQEESFIDFIREKGIVGMGGAAFPTYAKISSAVDKVDTLIANGCECEPYITSDDFLIRIKAEDVLKGIEILGDFLKPKRLVLAIENNKKEAIQKLQSLQEDFPNIEIKVLPTRYPQGSEKQLIQAVTGREVPPKGLPADVNCAVFNVTTLASIKEAVIDGKPSFERIVTVSGEGIKKPGNFLVKVGTPIKDLIKSAGGLKEEANLVINGGPMMGTSLEDLDAPITKATNSILCLISNKKVETSKCIRCGKCLSVCPMKLQPLYLYRFSNLENYKKLEKLNLIDCIGCGACSYICPAKLPLTETFRKYKNKMKEVK